jgi:protein phosphatase
VPEHVCLERNAVRPDRDFGPHVVRRQRDQLRRGLRGLAREGFRAVHTLHGIEEIADAAITRTKLYNDLGHETGPFDVIGDVHGCLAELESLLTEPGYGLDRDEAGRAIGAHQEERRAVFVGDLVDADRTRPACCG